MGLSDLLKPVDPAARADRSADDLLRRRNRWSVLFTLLVAVAGLLAVLFLPDDEIAAARDRWNEQEPSVYQWSYSIQRQMGGAGTATMLVSGGQVAEASTTGGVETAMSVDDLFDVMAEHGILDVRYADDRGHPVEVTVGSDATPDSVWTLQVIAFEVIED